MSDNKPKERKSSRNDRPAMGRGGHWGAMDGGKKAKDVRGTILRLLSFLKAYPVMVIIVLSVTLVRTFLDSVGPSLTGRAIDGMIAGDWDEVQFVVIARILLGITIAGGGWLDGYLSAMLAQRTVRDIRNKLIAKVQTLSLRFFDGQSHGDLMSRLTNDVETVNGVLTSSASQLIGSAFFLVSVTINMFRTNVPMSFVTMTVSPLMFYITRQIVKYTRKRYRQQQEYLGDLNDIIEETISAQKVVKAYVHEDATIGEFAEANRKLQKVATEAEIYSGAMGPTMNLMNNISLAIVGTVGGLFVIRGWASIGVIASFMAYSGMFSRPLNQIANLINSIQSALAGAERVFETLDEVPELTDKSDAVSLDDVKGKVLFENVDFGYDKDIPVLKNITMYNNAGETIALVGPTGAGKTTIINLLTRFYDIDSGSIKIDDVDLRDYKKDDLRRKLGLVLQDNFLFADTVMENIRYGRLDATDEDVMAAATLAEADAFIHRLPKGYETELNERGSNLSLGQRQLLAIARAILADPEILILDEATSNVDTRTEKHLQAALLKLMKGRTSFVIAHRLSTIRDADCVMVINAGEIIERGTHDELLERQGFYYNLYMSQFKGQNPDLMMPIAADD